MKHRTIITNKRQQTLRQWQEQLNIAEEKLENSKKCYEKYKDPDSLSWVKEDAAAVEKIKEQILNIQKLQETEEKGDAK